MTDMTQEQVKVYEAAKVVRSRGGLTVEQIKKAEMRIKRASIIVARRGVFGPTCAPTLKDQVRSFVSFGTLIKYDWLMNDERYWN